MINGMQKTGLDAMIGPREKVFWRGKPDKKCFYLEAIFNPFLVVAILWGAIDIGFISAMHSVNSSVIIHKFVVFFFALHLFPVWLYLFGILFVVLRYKHTEFMVTDRGVYTSGGVFAKTYEMKPYTEVSHINIHRGIFDQWLGVGDVVMSSNQDGYNTRSLPSVYRGITICDIADFQKVYNIVKELQTDVFADTMYPNALRPQENRGYDTTYTKAVDRR